MFCQNCGTKNEDQAVFCASCGSRLVRENTAAVLAGAGSPAQSQMTSQPQTAAQMQGMQVTSQSQAAVKKPMPLLTKIILAEIAVFLIAGYMAYNAGQQAFSAQETAKAFFVNMANGDWESAYEQLDAEESDFINSEMFAQANREKPFAAVSSYAVDYQKNRSGDRSGSEGETVSICYRTEESETERDYPVSLHKMADKNLFLFDSWKVGAEGLICEDYTVTVPAGASVRIDGIELSRPKPAEEKGDIGADLEQYSVPQIFAGTHTLEISMEDRESVKEELVIDAYAQGYFLSQMLWTREAEERMVQRAGECMQLLYGAAVNGQGFDAVADLFLADEESRETCRVRYEAFVESLMDNRVPEKISFYDLQGSMWYPATVELTASYDVNFLKKDWWSGEMKPDQYRGGQTQMHFDFEKENGEFVIKELGYSGIYF